MEIQCPGCGKTLRIDDRYMGQTGICKTCQTSIKVPLRKPVPEEEREILDAWVESSTAGGLSKPTQTKEMPKPIVQKEKSTNQMKTAAYTGMGLGVWYTSVLGILGICIWAEVMPAKESAGMAFDMAFSAVLFSGASWLLVNNVKPKLFLWVMLVFACYRIMIWFSGAILMGEPSGGGFVIWVLGPAFAVFLRAIRTPKPISPPLKISYLKPVRMAAHAGFGLYVVALLYLLLCQAAGVAAPIVIFFWLLTLIFLGISWLLLLQVRPRVCLVMMMIFSGILLAANVYLVILCDGNLFDLILDGYLLTVLLLSYRAWQSVSRWHPLDIDAPSECPVQSPADCVSFQNDIREPQAFIQEELQTAPKTVTNTGSGSLWPAMVGILLLCAAATVLLSVVADSRPTANRFREDAERGDAEAQYNLGVCYHEGAGVPRDDAEAIKWYIKSAEQGHPEAQTHLGHCYSKGEGVLKDANTAAEWYYLAAEQGYAEAQYHMGLCYEESISAIPNPSWDEPDPYWEFSPEGEAKMKPYYEALGKRGQEATNWFWLAAEQGYAEAQYHLGGYYDRGYWGVEKDSAEAIKWYRKAAEQGLTEAQNAMGFRAQNDTEAAEWFRLSAEKGDAWGQYQLGQCYREGKGVLKDDVQAYMWFSLAGLTREDSRYARDYLGKKMTPQQIAEGQRRAQEWKTEHIP